MESQENNHNDRGKVRPKPDQKRPKKYTHPLQKGIRDFVTKHLPPSHLPDYNLSLETLVEALPKRYTVYQPLLLLPPNALTTPPAWGALYAALNDAQRAALFESVVANFRTMGVTHVAMNAPIALTHPQGQENRIRSPVGLVPLYGDFGTAPSVSVDGDAANAHPSEVDLQNALWVHTVQNQGIVQTWAPLYTMFSRGNITEKARVLGHAGVFEGLDEESLAGEGVGDVGVVDMYAGIGYFVFSYLKRGVKRVWGWEINGWSIEGLRRGCVANGWGCRVVNLRDDGGLVNGSIPELVDSLDDDTRVVIFHGDNQFAAGILDQIRDIMASRKSWNSIRHVNLGLLPSSRDSWDNATKMIDMDKGGWVHVHENVDVREIDKMQDDIVAEIGRLRSQNCADPNPADHNIDCQHVERVKTYAPGVMHCVFDIRLSVSQ
ncbi:tRNA(Phe) (4-demethylwyosine(37)-C(7)) aminocarboxypropyltransferase [Aspergillus glaucus CBS 516.65]|uniref:tRNA wybutosine-synthesizing protein 2 n=1 Tax=Aspergillus glaucus CBS 516.65 TaxID=1160497 RepID=A0A1L9VBK0_ASPGL|nr:hypothetical protein ASPGLDRAFT_50321 [Aspergillus glaucus CBS 516.65]OJJ81269.1 hypothetical protein ASPGLDRAFT_50321 [Aspergillus glaucus CBS 516.65]